MASIWGSGLIGGWLAAGTTTWGAVHDMAFIWGTRLSGGGLAAGPTGWGAVPDVVLPWGSEPLIRIYKQQGKHDNQY